MNRCAFVVSALVAIALGGCPDHPGFAEPQKDASAADALLLDTAQMDSHRPDIGHDAGRAPVAGDTCNDPVDTGAVGVVDAEGDLVVLGSNLDANTDYTTCDPVARSTRVADVVYVYTPDQSGILTWSLEATTLTLFTVDLRTDCDDENSMLRCDQCSLGCTAEVEVVADEPLYLVISGILTSNSPTGMGDFELTFKLRPWLEAGETCEPGANPNLCTPGLVCQDDGGPVCGFSECGDGILGYGLLACDDGNTAAGDGCSATCLLQEQGPGGATCDAAAELYLVATRFGRDEVYPYAIGHGDFVADSDLDASCASAAGPEALFVFELHDASEVSVYATDVDVLTVRREGAGDCSGEELVCTSEATTGQTAEFASLESGRYLLILDRTVPSSHTTSHYEVEVFAQPL